MELTSCSQIKIKKITSKDVHFLFALMNNSFILERFNEVLTTKDDWSNFINIWKNDEDENGFIIYKDNIKIGWFAFNNLLSNDKIAFLKIAVLLPNYQMQGIGTMVLNRLLKRLQKEGFLYCRLFTDCDNFNAQKCYRKCGFEVIDSVQDKMSNGTIKMRYLMECKL